MLKLLNEQICVILINKINCHYCFYIQFMIWVYDNRFNNAVTSKSWGAITPTWPCWRWNRLIFGGLLQKLVILMFMILVPLYIVKSKRFEHSLIIYWTALVSCYIGLPFFEYMKVTLGILQINAYGPFCHGAHKLDLSILFTTFFLWTSPPFIIFNWYYMCIHDILRGLIVHWQISCSFSLAAWQLHNNCKND